MGSFVEGKSESSWNAAQTDKPQSEKLRPAFEEEHQQCLDTQHYKVVSNENEIKANDFLEKNNLKKKLVSENIQAKSDKIDNYNDLAQKAAANNKGNCSGTTRQFLEDFANSNEFDGKNANQQMAHMQQNWQEVSTQEAIVAANEGNPAICGLENPTGHGHVVVMAQQDKGESNSPKVFCSAMNENVQKSCEDPNKSSLN
jgi:hypothetical protein